MQVVVEICLFASVLNFEFSNIHIFSGHSLKSFFLGRKMPTPEQTDADRDTHMHTCTPASPNQM